MFPFFSEFQNSLKKTTIDFSEKHLNANIDCKTSSFIKKWKLCSNYGIQSMIIPKKYGGQELDLFDITAILEGLGYGCKDNGLVFSINAHIWACQIPVLLFGNSEQKNFYLPKLSYKNKISANAITEQQGGSDIFLIKTTAIKTKEGYIINGEKRFITNAPIADFIIVYAKTSQKSNFSSISCFIIDKNTPGITISKKIEKTGLKTSPFADVIFNNCVVPKENLLGEEGQGSIIFSECMVWEKSFILVNSIGIMERILERCINYTRQRKSHNKQIGSFQAISHRIADMKTRLETARSIAYNTIQKLQNEESCYIEAAMSKLILSQNYIHNCYDALNIFGAYGLTEEYGIEQELRDALCSNMYSGTTEIQKNIIFNLL